MSSRWPRPDVGDPAPSIELVDRHGRPWRLADLVGDHEDARPVVLIFHRHIH